MEILILKILLTVIIIFLLCLFAFWCLPDAYVGRKIFHKLFYKPVVWLGLDHYWSLFAPEPPAEIMLIGIEVIFKDGNRIPWEVPELKAVNEFYDLNRTRQLKWLDLILYEKDPAPKEGLCRYVFSEIKKSGLYKSEVEKINILRYFQPPVERNFLQLPWLSETAFTFKV